MCAVVPSCVGDVSCNAASVFIDVSRPLSAVFHKHDLYVRFLVLVAAAT